MQACTLRLTALLFTLSKSAPPSAQIRPSRSRKVLKFGLSRRTNPSSLQRFPVISHRCGDAEDFFLSWPFLVLQTIR